MGLFIVWWTDSRLKIATVTLLTNQQSAYKLEASLRKEVVQSNI